MSIRIKQAGRVKKGHIGGNPDRYIESLQLFVYILVRPTVESTGELEFSLKEFTAGLLD